jgi:trigger factor
MPDVKTTVTELPESRVRVEAEVPAAEVERRVQDTARRLGRDLKMPGFRKGKVPPPIVIQRVGREYVLDETVRGTLGRWYVEALDASGIHPVGEPDVDLGDLPSPGDPLKFTIEIGVRPTAQLGDYKGVEAPKREPEARDEAVQAELDALRERAARLDTVEEPAGDGDFVVMDYLGSIDGEPFEGGEGRDQLLELGSGRLIPGFEDQLRGASAGEERTVDVTFPDDYGAEHLAGKAAQFAVTVNEVKRKNLPDLDDEFASDHAGFDTLDELREDVAARLREADDQRADAEYREAVLDAVVAGATVNVPPGLVDARARELWERMLHSLGHQGISKDAYLQIAGKDEESLAHEAEPEAAAALRREAVLAAIVEAEKIEPSDDELLDALREATPDADDESLKKALTQLDKDGRLAVLREDVAMRKAVDLVAENAKPIEPALAEARGKIWTPGDPE